MKLMLLVLRRRHSCHSALAAAPRQSTSPRRHARGGHGEVSKTGTPLPSDPQNPGLHPQNSGPSHGLTNPWSPPVATRGNCRDGTPPTASVRAPPKFRLPPVLPPPPQYRSIFGTSVLKHPAPPLGSPFLPPHPLPCSPRPPSFSWGPLHFPPSPQNFGPLQP